MLTPAQFVLWISHPDYCNGQWLKLTAAGSVRGLRAEQKERMRRGFVTLILRAGDKPAEVA